MIQTLSLVMKQWIARALALCVVGPLAAKTALSVQLSDGSDAAALLTSSTFGSGLIALLLTLLITCSFGVLVGRSIDRREGILNMAFVLGWVAWSGGRLGDVFRLSPSPNTLITLSIEGLAVTAAILLSLIAMSNPNKGFAHGHPDDTSRFDRQHLKDVFATPTGLLSMIAALLAGLVVAFLFGLNDLSGQSVGVGFFAGIGAGLAGTLVATSQKNEHAKSRPTPFAPIMIGVMLCSVVAPLVGLITPGAASLLDSMLVGDLPGFLIVSPFAWAMGALLGVPMGHSWVEHSSQQTATQAASA